MGEKQYPADCLIKMYKKIIFFEKSGRVYLILEQPNLLPLTKKLEEILNSEVRIISIFSSSK